MYCIRLTSIFLVLYASSVDTDSLHLEGSWMGIRGLNEKGGEERGLVVMKGREWIMKGEGVDYERGGWW